MARYRTSLDGIMLDVYEPAAQPLDQVALFFYGFPATIGENVVTDALSSLGYHVVAPHYPGTYDSDGHFTPSDCIAMVKVLVERLSARELTNLKSLKKVRLPKHVGVLVGYSFGALISIKACHLLPTPFKLVLMSPALTYGTAPIDMGFAEEGATFLEYIQRTRPFTYRLGDRADWLRLYAGEYNALPEIRQQGPDTVLVFVGEEDSSISISRLTANMGSFLESNFSGPVELKIVPVADSGHSLDNVMSAAQIDILASMIRAAKSP